jgi:hypothetical protein
MLIKYTKEVGPVEMCHGFVSGRHQTMVLLGPNKGAFIWLEPDKIGEQISEKSMNIIERLKNAANRIVHCGDYCHLYWNQRRKAIWLVMGDGDCSEPYTSMKDIRKMLKRAGAETVVIEAEEDPPEDQGWLWINATFPLGKTLVNDD